MTARKGGETDFIISGKEVFTLFMYRSERDLIDAFSHSLDDLSPYSVRVYILGVRRFFQFLADNSITNPTSDTVLTYKNILAESMSDSTVAAYITTLRRFFSWCEHEGFYPDIARDVRPPHVDPYHKREALSAVQIKLILSRIDRSTLEGLRNYSLFALMAATGLRTIEVRRADVGDIHSADDKYKLFVWGKGHQCKDKSVLLSDYVLTSIREYLSARWNVKDDSPLFAGIGNRNHEGRLTTRTISQIAKNAMKAAGFDSPLLTAHSLRHSAITLALSAGLDIRDVSNFARHSQIQGTLVYAHDISRKKKECEKVISNAIFTSPIENKTEHVQYSLPFPS